MLTASLRASHYLGRANLCLRCAGKAAACKRPAYFQSLSVELGAAGEMQEFKVKKPEHGECDSAQRLADVLASKRS